MLDLDAIKARYDAATPGEWVAGRHLGTVVATADREHPRYYAEYGGVPVGESIASADLLFITSARTDVRALVAEVERLRAYIATRHQIEDRMRRGLYQIAEFPDNALEITQEALGHAEDGAWLGRENVER